MRPACDVNDRRPQLSCDWLLCKYPRKTSWEVLLKMKTNGTGFTQRGEGGGRSFRGSSGYQEKWRGSVAAKSLSGMDGEGGGGGKSS